MKLSKLLGGAFAFCFVTWAITDYGVKPGLKATCDQPTPMECEAYKTAYNVSSVSGHMATGLFMTSIFTSFLGIDPRVLPERKERPPAALPQNNQEELKLKQEKAEQEELLDAVVSDNEQKSEEIEALKWKVIELETEKEKKDEGKNKESQ